MRPIWWVIKSIHCITTHVFKENEIGNDSQCKTGFVKLFLPLGCSSVQATAVQTGRWHPGRGRLSCGHQSFGGLGLECSSSSRQCLGQDQMLSRGVKRRSRHGRGTPKARAGAAPSLSFSQPAMRACPLDGRLEGCHPAVPLQPNPGDLSFQPLVLPQTQRGEGLMLVLCQRTNFRAQSAN